MTHSFASAEWTAIILCSVVHLGLPLMGMTFWTIRAYPVHLSLAVWGDVDVAPVSVLSMVPLLLQLWAEPADVWILLPSGLLTDEMDLLDSCSPYQPTACLVCLCARAIAPDMPVPQGLPEARNGLVTGCGAASVWLEMACKLLISYARRSHEQLRT